MRVEVKCYIDIDTDSADVEKALIEMSESKGWRIYISEVNTGVCDITKGYRELERKAKHIVTANRNLSAVYRQLSMFIDEIERMLPKDE